MTATKTGLGKAAYTAAVKAANEASLLESAKADAATYQKRHDEIVALRRQLRQLHVDNAGTYGIGQVENAISELSYSLTTVDSYLVRANAKVAQLTGEPKTDDNDE